MSEGSPDQTGDEGKEEKEGETMREAHLSVESGRAKETVGGIQ